MYFFPLKRYRPRTNKKRFKKSSFSPDSVKRKVREIEARGGGPIQHERCLDTPLLKEFKS